MPKPLAWLASARPRLPRPRHPPLRLPHQPQPHRPRLPMPGTISAFTMASWPESVTGSPTNVAAAALMAIVSVRFCNQRLPRFPPSWLRKVPLDAPGGSPEHGVRCNPQRIQKRPTNTYKKDLLTHFSLYNAPRRGLLRIDAAARGGIVVNVVVQK
jgi:hypothetical protein